MKVTNESISKLSINEKHEIAAMFFTKRLVVNGSQRSIVSYLKKQRRIILNEKLDECGFVASGLHAAKKVLEIIYGTEDFKTSK